MGNHEGTRGINPREGSFADLRIGFLSDLRIYFYLHRDPAVAVGVLFN